MKICPKCKKQYDENQKFCKICGTALVEEKKKKRIGLYILIAILAIVACAGAVVTGMVIQNKKQEAQRQEELVSKTEESKDEKKEESEEVEKKKAEEEKTEDEKKKEEENDNCLSFSLFFFFQFLSDSRILDENFFFRLSYPFVFFIADDCRMHYCCHSYYNPKPHTAYLLLYFFKRSFSSPFCFRQFREWNLFFVL